MTQTPSYWQSACRKLARRDAKMAALIRRFPNDHLRGRGDAFKTLCRSIVGQQISLKAADSIHQSLEYRIGRLTPSNVKRRRHTTLRQCGLSENKAHCLKSLATFFIDERITRGYWQRHDLDTIHAKLTSVKGVGNWTFQMFAIFYLQHPDIYPIKDMGLINAIQKLYGGRRTLQPRHLLEIGENWAPWRTVATWYLWRSIDPEPVIY